MDACLKTECLHVVVRVVVKFSLTLFPEPGALVDYFLLFPEFEELPVRM